MSQYGELLKAFPADRSQLIKALQSIQKQEGYISDNALVALADYFSLPPVEVEGVVSFYAQFKRTKPGRFIISVCDGTACHIKGSSLVTGWISEETSIKPGECDSEGLFSLDVVACLGCCSLAPVISINGTVYGNLDRKSLINIIRQYRKQGGAK